MLSWGASAVSSLVLVPCALLSTPRPSPLPRVMVHVGVSVAERSLIDKWRRQGKTASEVAKLLSRDLSTISLTLLTGIAFGRAQASILLTGVAIGRAKTSILLTGV